MLNVTELTNEHLPYKLSDGWEGTVIHTEIYFNIFDAGMVTAAMLVLNVLHPGLLMRP